MYLVFRSETRFNFVPKFKFYSLTNSLTMIWIPKIAFNIVPKKKKKKQENSK